MSRLPLIALLLVVASCNTIGPKPKPAPERPNDVTLEARTIGLTEELDRLAKRVAALEREVGVAVPRATIEPARAPEPVVGPPAAPPADLPILTQPPRAAGVTGILIDAREARTEGEKRPAGTRHERWCVLDFDGGKVFSSDDIPERMRRLVPIFWLAGPTDPIEGDVAQTVGATPARGSATYAEILSPADGTPETLFYIDAATVSRLRSLPDFERLVSAGRVAIVLAK